MLDGFDFEDDLGSLAESENEQVKAPPPKQNLKDIFSEDSDQEKPKSTIDKNNKFELHKKKSSDNKFNISNSNGAGTPDQK